MTTEINNNESNEQALQRFLLDIECLDELLPWTGKFNLFDVLKASRAEIRHSNVLGWLLAPNENHGLGDAFLRGILQRLAENDSDGKYDIFKLLLLDFYSFSVLREWKNIDILLISDAEKTLIAIENKVGSHEHSNQLDKYRSILEREYPTYQQIYIFLTPEGEAPSDTVNWDTFTYGDIVDVLDAIQKKTELQVDVAIMIRNYLEVIRRDIVEDQELIRVCNKIYSKHKKALDLIFEHCSNDTEQITEAIKDTLALLAEEGKIVFDPNASSNTSIGFSTVAMDAVLPPLTDKKGSWGKPGIYAYWIGRNGRDISGYFEIGGVNVDEPAMHTMQRMIDILKPKDKRRDEFKFKRLYVTKKYTIGEDDDVEESVSKAVKKMVADILATEKRVLESLSEE